MHTLNGCCFLSLREPLGVLCPLKDDERRGQAPVRTGLWKINRVIRRERHTDRKFLLDRIEGEKAGVCEME